MILFQPDGSLHNNSSVGLGGLEPPTLCLPSIQSNQLSYKPTNKNDPISAGWLTT